MTYKWRVSLVDKPQYVPHLAPKAMKAVWIMFSGNCESNFKQEP